MSVMLEYYKILSIITRLTEFSIGYHQPNNVPWEHNIDANKPTRSPGTEAMRHVMDGLMSPMKSDIEPRRYTGNEKVASRLIE